MSPENFVYWLQGRAELLPDTPPSAEEWSIIQRHLNLVLRPITKQASQSPNYNDGIPIAEDFLHRLQVIPEKYC